MQRPYLFPFSSSLSFHPSLSFLSIFFYSTDDNGDATGETFRHRLLCSVYSDVKRGYYSSSSNSSKWMASFVIIVWGFYQSFSSSFVAPLSHFHIGSLFLSCFLYPFLLFTFQIFALIFDPVLTFHLVPSLQVRNEAYIITWKDICSMHCQYWTLLLYRAS